MDIKKIKEFLFACNASLWAEGPDSSRTRAFCREDPLLRIVTREPEENTFGEKWATGYPDSLAYKITCDVYYGETHIQERTLVCVDGFRAIMPMPDVKTFKTVKRQDYSFACIVNLGNSERFNDYMLKFEITD